MEKSNTSKNDILEMMKKEKMKGMGGRGSSKIKLRGEEPLEYQERNTRRYMNLEI